MADLDVNDPQSVAELVDLPLCALADGTLQPFRANSLNPFYILTDDENALLSGQPSLSLHWKVHTSIYLGLSAA